jgi:hypothetical protein
MSMLEIDKTPPHLGRNRVARAAGSMMDVMKYAPNNLSTRNSSFERMESNNSFSSLKNANKIDYGLTPKNTLSYGLESGKVNRVHTNRKQDYETNVHIGGVFKNVAYDMRDKLDNNQ